MQKLTKFKVIFDLFTVCVYFIQQQNCKLYYIYLMIISEIQSEIGHCSCDSAKFKAPADFSHHAILCMTLSLICDLLANDLLYPLSVKYRGGKDQDLVKMLENSMLTCSLFLLEFH